MGASGVKHLGFTVPFYITQTQGQRWRAPSRGVCAECETSRERVFIRGDGTSYCEDCIRFDLAEAVPSDEMKREQAHPSPFPVETPYEKVGNVVSDDFEVRRYIAGPDINDPRIYDVVE